MKTLLRGIPESRITIAILIVLGAIVRLMQIDTGLWLDEIWSMRTSSTGQTVASIIAACKSDTHPPFFDLMLHGWLSVFGDNPLSGRFLGYFWGILGLFATWYYAERMTHSRRIALISVGLVVFNYFHIYYTNEVRFYGFLYVASMAIIAHLYLYLKGGKRIHLVVFVFLGVILMYTHYYAAFLLLALGIGVLLLRLQNHVSIRRFGMVAFAGFLILIGFMPWIPWLPAGGSGAGWIVLPKVWDFAGYLYNYTGKNPVEFLVLLSGIIAGAMVFRRRPLLLTLLFVSVLFGYLLPLIVSYLLTPLLHERYTMIYFPSLILIAAIGLSEAGNWDFSVRSGILLLGWVSIGIKFIFVNPYFKRAYKEPWEPVSMVVKEEPLPVYSDVGFWIDYYLLENELPPSRPYSSVTQSEAPFWVLKTPYDTHSLQLNQYVKVDSVIFQNRFLLEKYRPD